MMVVPRHNRQAFTLIELLIVVGVLGVLLSVVVVVMNPVRQRRRAKDGALKASMVKLSTTASSYRVAIGNYPTVVDFENELVSVESYSTETRDGDVELAFIKIKGVTTGRSNDTMMYVHTGEGSAGDSLGEADGCIVGLSNLTPDSEDWRTWEYFVLRPGSEMKICSGSRSAYWRAYKYCMTSSSTGTGGRGHFNTSACVPVIQ